MTKTDPNEIQFSINPFIKDIGVGVRKSDAEITKENLIFRKGLERATGSTFLNDAKELFKSRLYKNLDVGLFEAVLKKHIEDYRLDLWFENSDSKKRTRQQQKETYKTIFQKTCSDIYLDHYRAELSEWINKAEKGKAIFVDCLMGVGKTHSIVQTLGRNENLSAIVFFPTNQMCKDITERLKNVIYFKSPEIVKKYKGVPERSEYDFYDGEIAGEPIPYYSREFLGFEVYHADGIDNYECPYFNDIVSLYHHNWIKKKLVCKKCDKNNTCRFLHHEGKASKARIIVTTHHQYDYYNNNENLHYWNVNGEKRPRDLFIIDEDIVFSQLYQPINLKFKNLKAFIGTITDYLQEHQEIAHLRTSVDLLFSHINKCDKTSIIRAIDRGFQFPESFIKDWDKTLPKQPFIVPEYIEWKGIIGNHLKVIEHAIKFGAVVEKWGKRFDIHLPNPRSYDLSALPVHIFFDGTMLDEKFLANKLTGVEFEKLRIDIKCPWLVNVKQNKNSDLPEKWIERDKPKIQAFIDSIIEKTPIDKRIFVLTKNAILKAFLKDYIVTKFPDRQFVRGYFGNIRGINDAKECKVGIMLGSFMPSDSVEIAMALEFIDPSSLGKDITLTENNLWKWKDTNSIRTYNDEYAIIGEMAKAYRHSEHRQALARTRYLFHDVDFYIVSKDPVSDYDPFLPKPIDEQFRADLFPPRAPRPEKQVKYDEISNAVGDWLKSHNTVNATEIHEAYNIRRQTVGNKLKEMESSGILATVPGKRKPIDYRSTKNGHDSL